MWRLAWALPLVLMVGAAVVLVLRRFVVPTASAAVPTQRMRMLESLPLSDDTRVHLIEVDGRAYLVVESARHAVLQSAAPLQAGDASRLPIRFGPAWAQRFWRGGPR